MRKTIVILIVMCMALITCQSCITDTGVSRAIKSADATVLVKLPRSGGSGVYISENLILTCAHVVRYKSRVKIHHNGKVYDGEVIKLDMGKDLALILCGIEATPIKIGAPPSLGARVISSGHPWLLPRFISFGRVGALSSSSVTHDSALNGGNSGGPLFNSDGELIGINHSISTNDGQFAGMSKAINIKLIKIFLKGN